MGQKNQRRAVVLLLDSLGVGASRDAGPDADADTLGHIAEFCMAGLADKPELRSGPLHIPNLTRWGLAAAYQASTSKPLAGIEATHKIEGAYGYAKEVSVGKDTPSGHWELMGVPVMDHWTTFPGNNFCFPKTLIEDFIREARLPGVLGECRASGTQIIEDFGEEHIATGKPIVYTSADSVFQIAAHEDHYGLEALYRHCEIARILVDPLNVGRVIARPFVGNGEVGFTRTGNRRDWAMPPGGETLFDILYGMDRSVIAIGKTADIFAHRGVSENIKANGIDGLFDATIDALNDAAPGSLIFTNFVDFDSHFGHRRDVTGYADALERLDAMLPRLEKALGPNDVIVITADHGCDPTWPGCDHTREHIPLVFFGPKVPSVAFAGRNSFADVGQTLARWLDTPSLAQGKAIESLLEMA